jgi:hypothetical protein
MQTALEGWRNLLKPFDKLRQRLPLRLLLLAHTSTSSSSSRSSSSEAVPGDTTCRLLPADIELLIDSEERSGVVNTLSNRLEAVQRGWGGSDGPYPGLTNTYVAAVEGLDVLRLSNWTVLEDSLRAVNSPIQQQQQQQQQQNEEFVLHLQRVMGEKDTKAARREAETAIYEYKNVLAGVSKCVIFCHVVGDRQIHIQCECLCRPYCVFVASLQQSLHRICLQLTKLH